MTYKEVARYLRRAVVVAERIASEHPKILVRERAKGRAQGLKIALRNIELLELMRKVKA